MTIIYKIVPQAAWRAAEELGVFVGAPVDLADGFIHFSTATQVEETAARHFAGQRDLLLIACDSGGFGEKLVWEPSRGGALFPHLYGPLDPGAALGVHRLPEKDGGHDFTGLLP
ncbi:MAG: DUF952 domain-containing protein [Rhodoblastus sp.]